MAHDPITWPESVPPVVLRFRSAADRADFLAGLSDGFGESFVALHRPPGQSLRDAESIGVEMLAPWEADEIATDLET